jgi:DNA invertase Pin-like site-specific DNA recombinase
VIDLSAILLRRADEQTAGSRLPADGRDPWAIGKARQKPGPKGPRTKFAPEQVRRIRRAHEEGEALNAIAARLGCSKNLIQRICDGSSYGEVE